MKLICERSCCFTGHRHIPPREGLLVRRRLRAELPGLLEKGVDTFLAGGAIGFDTLAAQEILRARAEGDLPIRLVLVLPCLGQESLWSQRDAAVYRALLRQADEVIYTGDAYTRDCMFRRNRYLVDHSAYCLCYLTKTGRGGTAYTVKYARDKGLGIVNLAEVLLPEETAEEQLSFLPAPQAKERSGETDNSKKGNGEI